MKKKYELTEEHRAQLKPWADKWIKNAMSTEAMTEEDKAVCRIAVRGLYESAGLTPPPNNRIVFVSSPFVARFAAGFASAIWYNRNKGSATDRATYGATYDATDRATIDATIAATIAATIDATIDATYGATYDATIDATSDATIAATIAATIDATIDATDGATSDATDGATSDATDRATYDATDRATIAATIDATIDATDRATYRATRDATIDATYRATDRATKKDKWFNFSVESMIKLSTKLNLGKFGLSCSSSSSRFLQGGNQWSGYASFLSFFKHVAKLDIDYSKWDHWEQLAICSGPRYVHKEFCIISDRPEILTVDSQNRPHAYQGPFCKWRDGSALYSIHGVRVPMWIAETKKEDFTKEMILSEKNVDNRRCIIQKIGIEKTIELLGAEVIDTYESSVGGKYELLSIDYTDTGTRRPYLKMTSKSIDAVHIEGVGADVKTVKEAIMFRNKLKVFIEPTFLS